MKRKRRAAGDSELDRDVRDFLRNHPSATVDELLTGISATNTKYGRLPQEALRTKLQQMLDAKAAAPVSMNSGLYGQSAAAAAAAAAAAGPASAAAGESDSASETHAARRRAKRRHEKKKRRSGAAAPSAAVAIRSERPAERLSDLAGVGKVLQAVREIIEYPMRHPELYSHLGVEPPCGVLLHGPPGCGKTHLAHALAGELGCTFISKSAPEIVTGESGKSEEILREIFRQARAQAPTIIFIDEIDAIAPKREETQHGMERRIVAQLLTCMDNLRRRVVSASGGTPAVEDLELQQPAVAVAEDGATSAKAEVREEQSEHLDADALSDLLATEGAPSNLDGRRAEASAAAAEGEQQQQQQEEKEQPLPPRAPVMVIAATNRPDAVDAALRRAGRFDREICLGIPDKEARQAILEKRCSAIRLEGGIDFGHLARKTPGYVGADLTALTKEAAIGAVNRYIAGVGGDAPSASASASASSSSSSSADGSLALSLAASLRMQQPEAFSDEDLISLEVRMCDFEEALERVQPAAMREGFATVPDVSWDDIGALREVRDELELAVLHPLRHPEQFEQLGLGMPTGVLLYGPPGCGKTLLAKAIAHESNANFMSVKGPELLDKFVGESERAVRQLFQRARTSSPCVIFFDELDALCPQRGAGGSSNGSSGVSERVVNQLLTEMDGLTARRSVFVIAATNRPDVVDPAMLRPGRLDKLLYVPLPSAADRVLILQMHLRNMPIAGDVDASAIAQDSRCDHFSGADVKALVREAAMITLRASLAGEGAKLAAASGAFAAEQPVRQLIVSASHFDIALNRVTPSVSKTARKQYAAMKKELGR